MIDCWFNRARFRRPGLDRAQGFSSWQQTVNRDLDELSVTMLDNIA
jgi:hypothetical protein